MTERVYRLVLEPEELERLTLYVIDRSGQPAPADEEEAESAFDVIMCSYEGYYVDEFDEVSKDSIPKGHNPYEIG